MFSTAKHLFKRWFRDTVHYLKTGESTIYGEGGHRVFLHPSGYSRVDSYDLWQSEGAKKALEWTSQLHRSQTTPQSIMENDQDKKLEAICEYLKNNPNRLMELLEEIPAPKEMKRFPMKDLYQEYLEYDCKIFKRETRGAGHQWSVYRDRMEHPDPDCKWYWQSVPYLLAKVLENRYLIDCVEYTLDTSDTHIESDNECTYTP